MGTLVSILGGVLKVIGLVDAAERFLERWQAKKAGEQLQKGRDDAASLKDATQARKIDAAVDGLSDADLDAELRPGSHG